MTPESGGGRALRAGAWKAALAFLITGLALGAFEIGKAAERGTEARGAVAEAHRTSPLPRQEQDFDPALDIRLEGWEPAADPEIYERTGLFGYIDGGAEIFLQYGFEAAAVLRFTKEEAGPEIAVEVCRMDSPADAFGIYSVKREGDERISRFIETENWVGPSQASFVKGRYYVSLLGDNRIGERDLEAAAAEVEQSVPGAPVEAEALLPAFAALPIDGRIDASRRYIRGNLAAVNESPLFEDAAWGFAEKGTKAYSAKYAPANSRVVLVDFGAPRDNITGRVEALFAEFLKGVARDRQVVRGRNAVGNHFLFKQAGRWAALVLGEPNPDAARSRLDETLANASPREGAAAR